MVQGEILIKMSDLAKKTWGLVILSHLDHSQPELVPKKTGPKSC